MVLRHLSSGCLSILFQELYVGLKFCYVVPLVIHILFRFQNLFTEFKRFGSNLLR